MEASEHVIGIASLAIVVPCHNEEESLPLFLEETRIHLSSLRSRKLCRDYYFIFVDDGSTDNTLALLRHLHESHKDIHYVSLSRNFGKEAALLCGMQKALEYHATHVVVMDADLQDPPSLLVEMATMICESATDVVAAYRETREGEPAIRSWFARQFYALEKRICDVEMRDGARDYRMMTSRVVSAICNLPERERFSKGLFQWVGFRTEWLGYKNIERVAGNTSWSFLSLVRYALDGIISFSSAPLEAISITGLSISLLALLGLIVVVIRALCFGDPVSGWPSLVCIILFLGGLQLSALGVIGLYLSKVLSETKARPRYIIAESA